MNSHSSASYGPLTSIVTGSSSGIGRGIAAAFLERGDRVVLHGRDEAKLIQTREELGSPERTVAVAGDIADPETGRKLISAAVERFGSADVLVNNAGVFGSRPFVEVEGEELDRFLFGNLRGTYVTTQAVVRYMQAHGGGAIVNIGTVLVDHAIGGLPSSAALVSKGGVHALTKALAAELAKDSIRVNMVAPGMVRTPLHGDTGDEALGSVALLQRVGAVEEIAASVLHLADSEFTTGVILPVDGGFVSGRV